MKKNVMMRLASFLLIAVLISTSAISGTYAKYVTDGTSQDTARVAKFGVEVIGAADMFETQYAKDDSSFTLAANTVVSSNSDKLVAPGTSGSLTDVALTGTPEVAVRVTYEATLDLAGWNVAGAVYYCPITITVEGTPYYGMDYANEAAFEEVVEAAIEACAKDYSANTDLSATGVDTNAPSVSWAWAFEGSDGKQTDEYDTALGDQAADDNAATIDLTVVTTVTQID